MLLPTIELVNITNYALRNLSLQIMDRELLTLMGPNGAGKTTLLNVIAGLTDYKGQVLFDGRPADDIPAENRQIGYIFQRPLLFPHLDVASNVAYGLKARGLPKREVEARTKDLLKSLGIEHLKHRYPGTLSGGEQQRVAWARALATEPKVLLLDEPFNNLDAATRESLRLELKRLQKQLSVTTLFVTHDWIEAEEMGGRIAVMNSGKVLQIGSPKEIIFTPKHMDVFSFIGEPNILTCDCCKELREGLAEVKCSGNIIIVPFEGIPIRKLAIHPSDVHISVSRSGGLNRFRGIVGNIKVVKNLAVVEVEVGGISLRSHLAKEVLDTLRVAEGSEVFVEISLEGIRTLQEGEIPGDTIIKSSLSNVCCKI